MDIPERVKEILIKEYSWQDWDTLCKKTGLTETEIKNRAYALGLIRYPYYLKKRAGIKKNPWKNSKISLHPFVGRALRLMDFICLFAGGIVYADLLKENGISKGEATYVVRVLRKLGALEQRSKTTYRINHDKVVEILDGNVWKNFNSDSH